MSEQIDHYGVYVSFFCGPMGAQKVQVHALDVVMDLAEFIQLVGQLDEAAQDRYARTIGQTP